MFRLAFDTARPQTDGTAGYLRNGQQVVHPRKSIGNAARLIWTTGWH